MIQITSPISGDVNELLWCFISAHLNLAKGSMASGLFVALLDHFTLTSLTGALLYSSWKINSWKIKQTSALIFMHTFSFHFLTLMIKRQWNSMLLIIAGVAAVGVVCSCISNTIHPTLKLNVPLSLAYCCLVLPNTEWPTIHSQQVVQTCRHEPRHPHISNNTETQVLSLFYLLNLKEKTGQPNPLKLCFIGMHQHKNMTV